MKKALIALLFPFVFGFNQTAKSQDSKQIEFPDVGCKFDSAYFNYFTGALFVENSPHLIFCYDLNQNYFHDMYSYHKKVSEDSISIYPSKIVVDKNEDGFPEYELQDSDGDKIFDFKVKYIDEEEIKEKKERKFSEGLERLAKL